MIAKILVASSNFAAIQYNEKKVKQGNAELIYTDNFGYLDILDIKKEADFKKYLTQWGNRNTRMKSTQLHISISCKGKLNSKEELLQISKKWLYEMGYKGIPHMIYFHNDTDNNHVHIITSRVGIDGKKINDSNERYRSREVINRITKNDLTNKCRNDFARALSYNFETIQQFDTVLSCKGYSTKIIADKMQISREGKIVMESSLDIINWSSLRNIENKSRKNQIKAIFNKYSKGLNIVDFQSFIKSKFGIEIVLFGKEDARYGYSIIDNSGKNVFKGSEIMSLKNFENNKSNLEFKINNIINSTISNQTSIDNLKLELRKQGLLIRGNEVIIRNSNVRLTTLTKNVMNEIKQREKIEFVNSFHPKNVNEARILSNFYNVEIKDIRIDNEINNEFRLKELFNVDKSAEDIINELGLKVIVGEDDKYIIDLENKELYSFYDIGIVDDRMIKLHVQQADDRVIPSVDNMIETILDNTDDHALGSAINNELPKKRKR